jgi:immunoglobulin-binding protein 1
LVDKLKAIAWHVDQLRLFSPNEELDDINTSDLKFLLVTFLLAETVAAEQDMEKRLGAVKTAMVFWKMFGQHCERLGVAHADDLAALARCDEESLPQAKKREEKIARFRRSKEFDDKCAYYFAKKKRDVGDEFQWGSYGGTFDEEMERELILSLLRSSVIKSLENLGSAQRELPMLEMLAARGGLNAPPPKVPPPEPTEPWIMRIRNKAELDQLYRQQVFQPSIPLPTMTLAEAAEYEMADMRRRQELEEQKKRASAAEVTERWFDGDRYGAQEDFEDELKADKARDWDDWKDDNPKGSGNRMANVG